MSKTKKSRAIRKKNRVKATKVAAGSDKGKGGSNNDGRGNNDGGSSQGTAAAAAAEYLQQWAEQQRLPKGEEGAWKFAKKRQVFLLKSWADRQQVSADTFKLLLLYARSLPEACAERTVKHAKDVAASAEKAVEALAQSQAPTGDEDDDDDDDDDDDRDRLLRLLRPLLDPLLLRRAALLELCPLDRCLLRLAEGDLLRLPLRLLRLLDLDFFFSSFPPLARSSFSFRSSSRTSANSFS